MKYKLTFALVASLTSSAFAAFQAPLPEFKNEKQLAEWRAEKASEATSQGYAAEETAFYTGRPYLASSGGYAFKYRSYNPELARWTSEDPSGFPDGANQNIYAPTPTEEYDVCGLYAQTVHLLMTTTQMKNELWNTLQASSLKDKAVLWSAIDAWCSVLAPEYNGQYNWDTDAHTQSITDNGGTAGITGATGFSAYAETISITSGKFEPPVDHDFYPGSTFMAYHYELEVMFTVTASGAFSGTWNFGRDPNKLDQWYE